MLTKEEILDKEGFDFDAFQYDNEYSAKAILKAMEEYANQDKWISIENELPYYNQYVLVSLKSGTILKVQFLLEMNGSFFKYGERKISVGSNQVTHWQPLPAPPKQ